MIIPIPIIIKLFKKRRYSAGHSERLPAPFVSQQKNERPDPFPKSGEHQPEGLKNFWPFIKIYVGLIVIYIVIGYILGLLGIVS